MIIRKLKRAIRRIQTIPKTEHKPYLLIALELIIWVISNRGELNFYFNYELFIKGKRSKEYLKSSQFSRIEKCLNSPEYYTLLEDKYYFSQILMGQGFRSSRNLFLIDQYGIFNLESKKHISNEEFLQNNFDGFFKLINGYGGKMIYQIEVLNKNLRLNKKEMTVSDLLTYPGEKKYLIQERIMQHQEMNTLNPSCLNTLRLLTIRNGQTFHFYHGYLRIGINNNFVDNGLRGNIMVGFDKCTGKLMEYAYSDSDDPECQVFARHPQSNISFKDYRIPFFEESVEMVKSLHLLFQQFFMIGWDIGITPDGPIVIEGNNITTLYPFQLLYGGLKTSFVDLANKYQK